MHWINLWDKKENYKDIKVRRILLGINYVNKEIKVVNWRVI